MPQNLYEINTLALWQAIGTKGFSIRAYGNNYAYTQNGIIVRSSPQNPVARFAKNYTKGKKQFSLGTFSNETDTGKMEKWLDAQAKKIKASQIDGKWVLLDVKYGS